MKPRQIFGWVLFLCLLGCLHSLGTAEDIKTPAEEVNYAAYSQYEAISAFLSRLDAASPNLVVKIAGRTLPTRNFSPRDLFLCILTEEGVERVEDLDRILLTGSGGPFRTTPARDFASIKPEDALKHPNWAMGKKITIDSATLMNKGLEIIEAKWLFSVSTDRIQVVIHPQSIVHSMVSFKDGSVIAQLGIPDMKTAIAYALSYPERLYLNQPIPDFVGIGALTFEKPDLTRFPCLALAFDALQMGQTFPAVLNASNEAAVEAFLSSSISFQAIPEIIRNTLDAHNGIEHPSVSDILAADLWAREKAAEEIELRRK